MRSIKMQNKNASVLPLLSCVDGTFLHPYRHHNFMNQFNLQFSLIMKYDIQEVFTSKFF
jgi:hypothetical protein